MSEKVLNESQSSIKVSKNSKGYTWEVKIYDFDVTVIPDKLKTVIKKIDAEYSNGDD